MNLNQVTIPSLDVYKSTEFYKTLGLKLIVDALPRYVRFECPDGDATFSVHLVEELPRGEGISIYFEDKGLDNKVKDLIQKGLQFDELPNDKSWGWREARLRDVDNNQIIIFDGGTYRKNPPWRVEE
ncbi:MAG: VOC family protein [Flavobacteriaceae bacterium]|nr:VOC family protein [Flavobacteriaceae bacterium]